MRIINEREEIEYKPLGEVQYGKVFRFKEHNGGNISRWPSSLGFNGGSNKSLPWTKRIFMLLDIWAPSEPTIIVADVNNGKTWKVIAKELVEVLDCELVLS